MRHLRHPATVIAIVALFAALSGGAIAGTMISGSQIKNHSIPAKKLTPGAVRHLRGHRGPAGPSGPTGAQGPAGPAGVSTITTVSNSTPICAFGNTCDVASVTATCPSGYYVVGGSAHVDVIETSISTFAGTVTYGAAANNSSSFSGTLTVTAVCATGPGLIHTASPATAVSTPAASAATRLRSELSQQRP